MKTTGNTILITGGGSGIGLGLARAFAKADNRVLIAGRSREKLQAVEKEGFATFAVDMSSGESLGELARQATAKFPELNVVIHSAGVMKNENLKAAQSATAREETVATNFLGPMRLNDALLPHLLKQKQATIMTVTSGLAYMPLAMTPTYCATKAAIHSYTESLRYQLQGTSVEVLELAPPYVRTSLMGERQANDENAMPLDEFIAEVMQILKEHPERKEVLVQRVMAQRTAAEKGAAGYEAFFKQFNDMMLKARGGEF